MADLPIDLGNLNESQQLALGTYTSVTNQEPALAIPLLERSEWNVQIAIAKFFDGEAPDPVAEARAALPSSSTPSNVRHTENLVASLNRTSPTSSQREPAPRIVPQPESQRTWRPPMLVAMALAPFNILTRLVTGSFSLIGFLLSFLPRLMPRGSARSLPSRSRLGRKTLDPRDTAARFAREFEEDYGRHDLHFFENGYASAYDLAKKDLKFLLVVLLSPEHDDTATFVQETLLSHDVVSYINERQNQILLWAGNVQDSEAYQVSTALNCSKFPFAALVALTPQDSSTSMSTITRMTGPQPSSAFITKLQTAIAQHAPALDRLRAQRTEQQVSRSLREEQNSAYERSLAQDRERTRLRREAEAAQARAESEAKVQAEVAAKAARNLQQWREWRSRSIRPEPEADADHTTRVSIRMTNGERVIRRFANDEEIEDLYAFVECYKIIKDTQSISSQISKPKDYEHKYNFRLVSPMPRLVYDMEAGGTIEKRIGRSANLIVELVDEESEDS